MNIPDLISAFKNRLDKMAEQQLKPVEIAVIDSGIDSTHPDLAKRIIEAYRVEIQDDKPVVIDVPLGENNDIFGHGTAVASIIARIAPNANIVDIRVLGKDNSSTGAALIEGLKHAIKKKSRIINMSLAAAEKISSSLFKLCEQAYYQNQLIVASKRNMPLTDYGFPAEFSSCISVDNDAFDSPFKFTYKSDGIIEYAAHGEKVAVAAAGGGYTTMTGTSFATPNVSALCTLLLGLYPDLRPFEVKTLLKSFAIDDQA